MKKPVFMAHRGAWNPGRRENTVGAIERAAKSGRFTYIEVDVRRTRSDDSATQTAVIFHDTTLDRLYRKYKIPKSKQHRNNQPISGLTLDIIRGEEIEIATLAEAMRAAAGHPLNLEIKSPEAIEPMLETINDMLAKYKDWSPEKIVVSSFNWNVLYAIKQRSPELGIALLYGWKNLPRNFGRHFHTLDARWISFTWSIAPFLAPLARTLDIRHRYAFTVNSNFKAKVLSYFGVNGFYTDMNTLPDSFPED